MINSTHIVISAGYLMAKENKSWIINWKEIDAVMPDCRSQHFPDVSEENW
jgi:hypothetical protein